MEKYSLLTDEMAQMYHDCAKNQDLLPSVRSICQAIWSMNNVHPTSQEQVIQLIDSYNWLQRAIQEIAKENES